MSSPFELIDLPAGRARFSSGIRGADELGHETFAIEIDGIEYFGELKNDWLPDQTHYDVAVVSFGFSVELQVGMPITAWSVRPFTHDELESIKIIIIQLIDAGTSFTKKPLIISESGGAIFTGKVIFKENWALTERNDQPGVQK
ncbi:MULTISPECIES: hypothetical protein [Xanthomonas]|uniref:hypothetical protein n=1 Tax=Xanthomonas TaxID=338 RepID=UPI00094B3BA6|nr:MULTISPECIES: hypothetical protein [Xanthomonas]MCL1499706.1 hypothetical protein [Xanthomonas nasturtii]MCL1502859.1 hypothetical protein [Xanthomonas nasturtii]MCL1524917.1 hypothetical protein [Xanthomonas nasturtii]MEB1260937.1 hypothetical protein [Xanthomonas campestris pv. campestris]MEB1323629.1 hypothetical protein [Xanthomonas campestris pv. campestris]